MSLPIQGRYHHFSSALMFPKQLRTKNYKLDQKAAICTVEKKITENQNRIIHSHEPNKRNQLRKKCLANVQPMALFG